MSLCASAPRTTRLLAAPWPSCPCRQVPLHANAVAAVADSGCISPDSYDTPTSPPTRPLGVSPSGFLCTTPRSSSLLAWRPARGVPLRHNAAPFFGASGCRDGDDERRRGLRSPPEGPA